VPAPDPNGAARSPVVSSVSVGGRNEAHHAGFTDDRRFLWASGLDTSRIFVFDVATDPAKPRLQKTITDFVAKSGGVVGPHTLYALPGRMMMTGLSNDKDHGGRTALVEYSNQGQYVATHWLPTADKPLGAAIEKVADGYGYDVRVLPRRNIMLTSSFTGWSNYMMDFGKMLQDEGYLWYEEPMREFELGSYSKLCDALEIPVLAAETSDGCHWNMASWIQAGALDMTRASSFYKGGITGAMKIAHLEVEALYGDFRRTPLATDSREYVFVCRRSM